MPGKRICIKAAAWGCCLLSLTCTISSITGTKYWWGWRKPSPSLAILSSFPHPSQSSQGSSDFTNIFFVCKGMIRFRHNSMRERGTMVESRLFLNPREKWCESQQSLACHHFSQLSHASKSIINPIMIEILMRCAMESDFGVIIRAILPVVESWTWMEVCSVAQSDGKKKCCYACRSCSHLS